MAATDEQSVSTITDLPEDCLRELLLCIPIPARIHLRRVCKKWCELIEDCWSAVREILCDKPTEEKRGIIGHNDIIYLYTSNRKILEGVMSRCGAFINCFADGRDEPDPLLLSLAVKYCRNIKKLEVTVSSKADDKYLNKLLAVNPQIRGLKLVINFKNAKVCLRTVPTDVLDNLLIVPNGQIPPTIFPPPVLVSQKQIVRKANSLRTFASYFVDEELIDIIGQKVELESVTVSYCGNSMEKDTFYPILNLKKIRSLALCTSWDRGTFKPLPVPIYDDFVIKLAANLQMLESLMLQGGSITDEGFMHLASLHKLEDLQICGCLNITDQFLYLFSGLEELDVSQCCIRDRGVVKLLRTTQTMRVLRVRGTLISNLTLIAAIKETKKRDNGISLELHVGDTVVTPGTLTESSPLLEIIDKEI